MRFNLRVISDWVIAFPSLRMTFEHFCIIVFIESFDGFTISLPLNFRKFQPRKSKPLSMCVIFVFSSDKVSPLVLRKELTKSFTSFAISFVFAVIIKSSWIVILEFHIAIIPQNPSMKCFNWLNSILSG